MNLKAVTYNVRGFRGGLDRVAEVVRRLEPDVLLLQETGSRERLRRFAIAVGMDAAADPLSPFRRRVKDAALVRPPLRLVSSRQHRFSQETFFYPRGAMIARVEGKSGGLWAVSVHLGLPGSERGRHIGELIGICQMLEGTVLVGGDLNTGPQSPAIERLGSHLNDVWLAGSSDTGVTHAGENERIDYLFASKDISVTKVWVEQADASDHRPVAAELTL